jgi:hypothetical protein
MRLAILALTFLIGCGGCVLMQHRDPLEHGLTEVERHQVPAITLLPGDTGYLFAFKFSSRDLTEEETFRLLRGVIKRGRMADMQEKFVFTTDGKVVIFAYEGKTVDVTATADFTNDEVELWTSYHDKDWYVKKTYKGDPDDLLDYMKQGFIGEPKVEEGKASEELKALPGKQTDCHMPGRLHLLVWRKA